MKQAQVIIGSGFGDEGKGLATDYFAALDGPDTLVIRFNGGSQAGHTVAAPDGRRHVFSQIGSGSFSRAASYLSRFFVANPILFLEEYQQLLALGVRPRVFADRRAPVTTPYDIMLNQALETARGHGRHGSCGMGFGETIERQERGGFSLTVGDLADGGCIADQLRRIRSHYLPRRMAELGLSSVSEFAASDELIDRFVTDARRFGQLVQPVDESIMRSGRQLLFEGAQGLLLDMDRGDFPHVTRSNTGLKNVVELAAAAGVDALRVSYMSRWYATRHGAGPMRGEVEREHLGELVDATNQPNDWQGSLRYGRLDTDRITRAVQADLADARDLRLSHEWFITWADKVPDRLSYLEGSNRVHGSLERLMSRLACGTGASGLRIGCGESRAQVDEFSLVRCASAARRGAARTPGRHQQRSAGPPA